MTAQQAQEYCRSLTKSSGSNFYYSFLFLPREQRDAMYAVYAFCREVDDVVDEVSDPSVAQMKLAWWRNEIALTYEGAPHHPATLHTWRTSCS